VAQRERGVDFKLELIMIPVSDVDRAKAFYTQTAGFKLEVDGKSQRGRADRAGDPARLGLLDRFRQRAQARGQATGYRVAGLTARACTWSSKILPLRVTS
jgi:catechol 2,3-dioxygenase-like lactoylglutathione lyase family enzyme